MKYRHIVPENGFSAVLAEDVSAPELRNPLLYSNRGGKTFVRILKKLTARLR